jgi:DNA-binding transcriptional MerR regulator
MPKIKAYHSFEQLETDLREKKYFTIGEVSEFCQLKSHVLRYWEQVFPQLEPNKRRGRRYYQRADVALVFEIKNLLHQEGFTIPGAKTKLDEARKQARQPTSSPALKTLYQIKEELQIFRTYLNQRY